MTIRGVSRDLSASGGQSERSLDMVGRTLRGSGPQASVCHAFIVGAVKMPGTEGQIALAVPFRGPHMQLTPARPQHGRIGVLLDQCVREQEVFALGNRQSIGDEIRARVVRRPY